MFDVTRSNGMNAAACSSDIRVASHQIYQLDDGLRLEVHIAIQGEQVRVLRLHLLRIAFTISARGRSNFELDQEGDRSDIGGNRRSSNYIYG